MKLELDIDLENQLWEPIGNNVKGAGRFSNIFDGNGHTIKNLNVDSKVTNNDNYASGFFGWLEQGKPVIKNIRIDGATIKVHTSKRYCKLYCKCSYSYWNRRL